MAVSRVFIIPIMVMDIAETFPPVLRMRLMICHHGAYRFRILTIRRKIGQSFLYDLKKICFHKSITDAYGYKNASIDPIPVMGHTGSFLCKLCRQIRIAGGYKPPGINKDLPADLFCDRTAILRDTAAFRRRHAVMQIQVRRMLCRNTISAPPEETMFKGCIVKQRFRHVLRLKVESVSAVLQRPQEEQRPVTVVVCRKLFIVHGIMI